MVNSLILFVWSTSESPFTGGTLCVTHVGGHICQYWALCSLEEWVWWSQASHLLEHHGGAWWSRAGRRTICMGGHIRAALGVAPVGWEGTHGEHPCSWDGRGPWSGVGSHTRWIVVVGMVGPGDCTQGMGGHGTWCVAPIGWEGPGRWRVTVGMAVRGIAPERWEGTAHWVGDDPIDRRTRWWVTVSMAVQGIAPEGWEEGHSALGVAPVRESSVAPVGWEGATAERRARWGVTWASRPRDGHSRRVQSWARASRPLGCTVWDGKGATVGSWALRP